MKRPDWMKQVIAAGGEYHWVKADPLRHNTINLLSYAALLAAGVGLMAVAPLVPWPVYVPIAGIIFGALFFGNFILVVHECSHSMFIVMKNRDTQKVVNRWIGIVTSAPFFTDYLKHWEKGHTTHHLRPCEPEDPQDRDPITGAEYFKQMAMILFIPGYQILVNPSNQYGFSIVRFGAGLLGFGVISGLAWFFSWKALVAVLWGFQVLMALNLTKKAQEHGAGLKFEPDFLLRSRTYFYPFELIFSPFRINYHFEHHANFNVPWYQLPAYHKKLRDIVPSELQPYIFHHDFVEQLKGTKPLIPDSLRHLTAIAGEEPAEVPAK